MKSLDLVIHGGMVVKEAAIERMDLGIAEGKIAVIESNITDASEQVIDATGLHIFPGVIDAHVHFNEPGRTEWEGMETGSRAVAGGGGTMYFDMPLNAHPPTLDAASFREKQLTAEQKSVVDFALWGGLVPQNLDKLEELARCGVIGFKAFMCNSGIDDFSAVNHEDLRKGMKRAAALKLPVAVHAESESLTSRLTAEALAADHNGIRDYLNSRPIQAELEAIQTAIELAGETGCSLHVVHISCGAGARLITEGRKAGVDVTCETCPHYLALDEEVMEWLGAAAKCAPPLRPPNEPKELWRELLAGNILTVGSDHSPSPPEMKLGSNFFKVWGGISGAQHLLPLMLSVRQFDPQTYLPLLSRCTSTNVARRFGLPPSKGRIAVGCDADLALVDLDKTFTVRAGQLLYRHRRSPYVGLTLKGAVQYTLLRGKKVGEARGHLIRPIPPN